MKYKDLEKKFQLQLHEQEVAINTNLLIADLFGKKREKKPFFLLWAAILAFLVSALSIYLLIDNKKVDKTPDEKREFSEGQKAATLNAIQMQKTNVSDIISKPVLPLNNESSKRNLNGNNSTLPAAEYTLNKKQKGKLSSSEVPKMSWTEYLNSHNNLIIKESTKNDNAILHTSANSQKYT